jgi:hypothetical protein
MHSLTLLNLALVASAPMVLAQRSSITSAASMLPMATPSRPAITMEWNTEPVAALAVSTPTSLSSSATRGAMMTMSDGSVMSMASGMTMGSRPTNGSAMAGMANGGSAGNSNIEREAWWVSRVMVSVGTGVGLLVWAI